MNDYPLTPSSLFRPAACCQLQFIQVYTELERPTEKPASRQFQRSRLQHRTSSDTDCTFQSLGSWAPCVFTAAGRIHQRKDSSNSCPRCHFPPCQLSVLFCRQSGPLASLHLELQKCTPWFIPYSWKWMHLFKHSGEEFRSGRGTRGRQTKCALASPCPERLGDSYNGPINAFHHRNHSSL